MKRSVMQATVTIVLIILSVIAVYHNSLKVPFQFDDNRTVVKNTSINRMSTIPQITEVLKKQRPLFNLSLAVDTLLHGKNSKGFHLTNMILHAMNGILLFLLLMKLTWSSGKFNYAAGAGALLFVVHPLTTESVTYITGRAELMAGFFILLSLYAFIWFRENGSLTAYAASLAAFPAGLACKESAAVIPLVIILYCVIFVYEGKMSGLFRDWKIHLPFLCILAAGFIAGIRYFGIFNTSGEYSPFIYLVNQFKVIVSYLLLSVFPVGLSVDHRVECSQGFFEPSVIFSFILVMLLLSAFFLLRKKLPLLSFAGCSFFIFLLPSSSIFPLNDLMAEHRAYLSVAALCIFMTAVYRVIKGFFKRQIVTSIVALLVFAAVFSTMGTMTYKRNIVWQSESGLWEDAVLKSGGQKGRPLVNAAKAYIEEGRYDDALDAYEKSLRFSDTYKPRVYLGMGYIHLQVKRDVEKAEHYFRLAAESSALPEAFTSLGTVLWQKRNYPEAIEFLEKGYPKMKSDPLLNFILGDCYFAVGELEKSNYHFNLSLEKQPENFHTNLRMGELKIKQGFWNVALRYLQAADRIKPGDQEVAEKIRYVEEIMKQ